MPVSGQAALTLGPGTYIIQGGNFTVSGNASVSGHGVFIDIIGHNGASGSLNLGGNGSFNLTPETSGPYAGILVMQSADDHRALALGGNAVASIANAVIYAPVGSPFRER